MCVHKTYIYIYTHVYRYVQRNMCVYITNGIGSVSSILVNMVYMNVLSVHIYIYIYKYVI